MAKQSISPVLNRCKYEPLYNQLFTSSSCIITTRPERGAAEAGSRRPAQSQAIVPVAAQRELVRRIVHSSTFGRSERLGTMLTYVCEMALKGREAELNEQKIGQAVFERAQD